MLIVYQWQHDFLLQCSTKRLEEEKRKQVVDAVLKIPFKIPDCCT